MKDKRGRSVRNTISRLGHPGNNYSRRIKGLRHQHGGQGGRLQRKSCGLNANTCVKLGALQTSPGPLIRHHYDHLHVQGFIMHREISLFIHGISRAQNQTRCQQNRKLGLSSRVLGVDQIMSFSWRKTRRWNRTVRRCFSLRRPWRRLGTAVEWIPGRLWIQEKLTAVDWILGQPWSDFTTSRAAVEIILGQPRSRYSLNRTAIKWLLGQPRKYTISRTAVE